MLIEQSGSNRARNCFRNFVLSRPDVLQINRRAISTNTKRISVQVNIDRARQSVSNNQRRRHQVVRLDVRSNPPLKVSVPRKHRSNNQVFLVNLIANRLRQRSRVTNTRRTSVSDDVEVQRLHVLQQARRAVDISRHAGTWSERSLHPRLDVQTLLNRLLRHQTSRQQHRRVRGVGTRRNRRNHNRPVPDRTGRRIRLTLSLSQSLRLSSPRRRSRNRNLILKRRSKIRPNLGQDQPILRPLRTCNTRLNRTQIEGQCIRKHRIRSPRLPEHPLRPVVSLGQLNRLRRSSRQSHVSQSLGINREDSASRAVLRSHVRNRRPIRKRHRLQARAKKLDKLANHAPCPEHLSDGQNKVSRRRTFLQPTRKLEPDDLRNQHRHRLTKHRCLRLDSADTPAQNAQAVDHRGVAVGTHQGIRISNALRVHKRHARQVL